MKSLSPQLLAFLESREAFHRADLFLIELLNGKNITATTAQVPITLVDPASSPPVATIYHPSKFGAWERGPVKTAVSYQPKSEEMSLSVMADSTILIPVAAQTSPAVALSLSVLGAVRAGLFDAANVSVYTIYWGLDDPPSEGVKMGFLTTFIGKISSATQTGRSKATFKVADLLYLLHFPVPRNIIQSSCRHTLFDTGCTLDKRLYAFSNGVSAGSDAFYINLLIPVNAAVSGSLATEGFPGLSSKWTVIEGGFAINNNCSANNGSGNKRSLAAWTDISWPADQEARVTYSATATDNARTIGPAIHIALTGETFYGTEIKSGTLYLFKVVNGVRTDLNTASSANPVAGDTLVITSKGSVLTASGLAKGLEITATDSSITGGSAGIHGFDAINGNQQVINAFEAANAAVGFWNTAASFSQGMLKFTSGQNNGLTYTIKSQINFTRIQLLVPLKFPAQVNDKFTMYPGCNKTITACQDQFNNLIHFGGMPFVPNPEIAI